MISKAVIYNAGTHEVYGATEKGTIKMLSIVPESATTVINVFKRTRTADIKLIATNTVIESDGAAYIDNRVIEPNQKIVIETDQTIHVDLNII